MLSRTLRRFKPRNEFDIAHLNDNIEMVSYPRQEQTNISTTKRICLFAQRFKLFFDSLSPLSLITGRERRTHIM